jgi:hypothetical protein
MGLLYRDFIMCISKRVAVKMIYITLFLKQQTTTESTFNYAQFKVFFIYHSIATVQVQLSHCFQVCNQIHCPQGLSFNGYFNGHNT